MCTGSIFRRKRLCQSNALVIPDVCAMFLCRILNSLCEVPAFKNHFRERVTLFPEVSIRFIQFLAFQGSITLVIHIDHANVHLVVDVVLLECLHSCKGAQVCADAHGTCATSTDQILVHSVPLFFNGVDGPQMPVPDTVRYLLRLQYHML